MKKELSRTIGIIYTDESETGFKHGFFSSIFAGIKQEAEANGFEIHFLNSDLYAPNRKTYLESARERNIDGIIMSCVREENPEIAALLQSDLPVVAFDQVIEGITSVVSDNEKGMETLLDYVTSMGHQRIALIYDDSNPVGRLRKESFTKTCQKHGLDIPSEYIRTAPFRDIEKTTYLTEEFLRLPEPPSCILYSDDYAAIGGINAIHARGLSIPSDISVAGYDGIHILQQWEPRLTTVRQNTEMIGCMATDQLIYEIQGRSKNEGKVIIIPSELTEGRTVDKVYF